MYKKNIKLAVFIKTFILNYPTLYFNNFLKILYLYKEIFNVPELKV